MKEEMKEEMKAHTANKGLPKAGLKFFD